MKFVLVVQAQDLSTVMVNWPKKNPFGDFFYLQIEKNEYSNNKVTKCENFLYEI